LGAELLRWCEDALLACRVIDEECNWLLLLRGEAQNLTGQWQEAITSVQEAIEASKDQDPDTYAQATLTLGRLELSRANYQVALKALARAEQLFLKQSKFESVATARSEIAAYHLNRRELDRALSLYLEAAALRERAGATELSDHTLLMLGVVYRKKGEYDQSAHYLQLLLNRAESRGNQGAIATAAHHLAWGYLNQGQMSRARQLCGRAITLYERIGDIRGASDAYEQLGLILLAEGEIAAATSRLNQSLTIRRQLGNQHGEASSLRHLAVAYLKAGRVIDAARILCKSFILYGKLGMLTRQRLASMGRELFGWIISEDPWTI
jgi:tetratricopeptide (TPR) repeat protein